MSTESTANTEYLTKTTGWADANPITIICWYRFNALTTFQTVWDHGGNTDFLPQLYYASDTNDIRLSVAVGPTEIMVLKPTPSTNTWYFTASVFNGTGNKVEVYFGTNGGALTHTTSTNNFSGFKGTVFTVFNEEADDQTTNGQITYMKIWRGTGGALSQQEVENEYLKGTPSKTTAFWGWFPLLNASNTGTDMSGNGNDLTVHGTPAVNRAMPPVTWNGKILDPF